MRETLVARLYKPERQLNDDNEIMILRIFGFLFLLGLFSCSTSKTEEKQSNQFSNDSTTTQNIKWRTYIDTVDVGFVLTFQYPDNLVAESIENGRCVGEPIKPEVVDGSVTNSMRWSIWMQDTSDFPIEHFISSEKSIFKGQVTELRDTININKSKAIRVTLKSDNKNDPYRQMIYLKKYSTLFEIINNYGEDKDFETFYNSLTIDETKKPSH